MDNSESYMKSDLQPQQNESIISNQPQSGHTTLPLPTLHYQSQNQMMNQNQIKCESEPQQQQLEPQQFVSQSQQNMNPQQMQSQQQNHIKSDNKFEVKVSQHVVTAQRVAEILKAAGETFCRLGECTMMLDQSANPAKSKWYESDVGDLAEIVKNFKDDLGRLSHNMQKRTSQKLKENLQKQALKQRNIDQNQLRNPQQILNQRIQVQRSMGSNQNSGLKREMTPIASQATQQEKRPRLQQQPSQQQPQQIQQRQNFPKVVQRPIQTQQQPQQQPQRQNGPKIPISAATQRSPIAIQRSQLQNNGQSQQQQQYTFQQTNQQGQRLVVNQQQVSTSNSVPIQSQQIQQVSQGQLTNINPSQQVQVQRVQIGNNQMGTTRFVMGSDQNGPKYTVQETVIDGKKTLILDHNDLARLLQSNNGGAVVLHQGSNDGSGQVQQGQSNQIVTVMQHQGQNQTH